VELYYDNSKKFETGSVSVGTATTAGGTLIDGWITTTQTNAVNNTTIATTAYVNNKIALIPAGLVFQGTWNAATNTPTLASGTGTTGHFYIVSVAGSTNLDGITDWKVGDWAVFIEQGASDQWEKIDNSSVLDGFGTGNRVAKWDGSGTSNTLTNSGISDASNALAITINGNEEVGIGGNPFHKLDVYGTARISGNASFQGDVSVEDNLYLTDSGTNRAKIQLNSSDRDDLDIIAVSLGSNMKFFTVDSERMRINSAGNVGIGTTSPDGSLTVDNTSSTVPNILLTNTAGNSSQILMYDNSGGTQNASITFDQTSQNTLTIATGYQSPTDLNRINIAPAGNVALTAISGSTGAAATRVGIGTTSPSYTLDVDGVIRGKQYLRLKDTAGTNRFSIRSESTFSTLDNGSNTLNYNAGFHLFLVGLSEKMRINSSGNVGIGTTSPADKLDLFDVNDNVGIYFHTTTSGTGGGDGLRVGQNNANAFVWNYEATPLAFATSGAARLTVAANGNIKFNTYGAGTLVTDASGNITVSSGGGAGGPYLPVNNPTFTGVLTGPSADLEFIKLTAANPGILMKETDVTDKNWDIQLNGGNLKFYEVNDARSVFSEKVTFQNGGNVGIGTTAPSFALDVLGDSTSGVMSVKNAANARDTFRSENAAGTRTFNIGNDASGHANVLIRNSSGTTTSYLAGSGNSYFNGGNIGIGTTGPNQKLQVRTTTTTDDSFQGINVHNNGTTGARAGICFQAYDWVQSAIWHGRTSTAAYAGALVLGTNPDTSDLTVAGVVARMVINNNGTIKFNAYGAGTLVTDASGNITVSSGGGAGGPYLPLTAGSTKPLTGDLYLKTTNDANIAREQIKWQTSQGTNRSFIRVGGSYADNALEFGTGNAILGMILHANGGLSIGTTVATTLPPASGLLVQGNVGIGTTSPGAKLEVNSGGGIHLSDDTAGRTLIIKPSLSGAVHEFTSDNTVAGYSFSNNASELMRIASNGNVGIGTTNPSQKLTVQGNTLSIGNVIAYADGSNSSTLGSTGYLQLRNSGSTNVNIRSNDSSYFNGGNVGIGTTSPGNPLEIAGANSTSLAYQRTGVSAKKWGFHSDNDATYWQNITDGGLLFTLRNGGNVGIGTTTPTMKLQIKSSSGDDGIALIQSSSTAKIAQIIQTGSGDGALLLTNGSGAQTILIRGTGNSYLNAGRVGIGTTSPLTKLHVTDTNAVLTIEATTNGQNCSTWYKANGNNQWETGCNVGAGTDYNIFDRLNSASRMVVGHNGNVTIPGNVGIGTTSPATQLEIFNNNDQAATLRLNSTVSDGDAVAAIISFANAAGSGGVQGRIESIATEDDATSFKFYTSNGSSPSMTLDVDGNMTIAGTLTQNSDARLKENIKPIESALDKVKQMQGVEFNKINNDTKEIGVIAQDIEKVLPELVLEDKEGIKSVAYGNITAVLIEAIKEQQKQIEKLKQQLNK